MAVFAFLRSTTVLVALLCVETGKAQTGKVKAEFDPVAVLVLSKVILIVSFSLSAHYSSGGKFLG